MPKNDWCGAIESLKQLRKLPNNWGGEESPSINPEVAEAAGNLLFHLLGKVLPPFICPIPGGTLQFEWTVGNKHLEIEFQNANMVLLLTHNMLTNAMKTYEIPLKEYGQIMEYLKWLVE